MFKSVLLYTVRSYACSIITWLQGKIMHQQLQDKKKYLSRTCIFSSVLKFFQAWYQTIKVVLKTFMPEARFQVTQNLILSVNLPRRTSTWVKSRASQRRQTHIVLLFHIERRRGKKSRAPFIPNVARLRATFQREDDAWRTLFQPVFRAAIRRLISLGDSDARCVPPW